MHHIEMKDLLSDTYTVVYLDGKLVQYCEYPFEVTEAMEQIFNYIGATPVTFSKSEIAVDEEYDFDKDEQFDFSKKI